MIDLSKQNKILLYPIKLQDGTILHIKQPTQGLLMEIADMKDLISDENLQESGMQLIDNIFYLMVKILNRNTDKKEFTKEDVDEMIDINTALLILQDYLNETVNKLGK